MNDLARLRRLIELGEEIETLGEMNPAVFDKPGDMTDLEWEKHKAKMWMLWQFRQFLQGEPGHLVGTDTSPITLDETMRTQGFRE